MASSASTEPTPTDEPPTDLAPMVVASTEAIARPDLDRRSYRWLQLSNQLQVMLVSDPECDIAAAAMDVHVGSASDPEELPGLAHFLEHMVRRAPRPRATRALRPPRAPYSPRSPSPVAALPRH
jgi:insulysin